MLLGTRMVQSVMSAMALSHVRSASPCPQISKLSYRLESPPLGHHYSFYPKVNPSGDQALLLNRAVGQTGNRKGAPTYRPRSEDSISNLQPPSEVGITLFYRHGKKPREVTPGG